MADQESSKPELFKYTMTVTGRLQARDGKEAEAIIRAGLSMTLPIHESLDSIVINTESVMDEFRRRFR